MLNTKEDMPSMPASIAIKLSTLDLLQVTDALESRAESWERTAEWLRGESDSTEFFIIEECSDPDEANRIAIQFREIIETINKQLPHRY